MSSKRTLAPLFVLAAVLGATIVASVRTPEPVAQAAAAGTGQDDAVAFGRYLIGFTPDVAEAQARGVAAANALVDDLWIPQLHVLSVAAPDGTLAPATETALLKTPGVHYVEPDGLAHAVDVPDDTLYGNQWAPDKIGAEEAWDVTTGSANVVVAVIDTGVDLQHEDFNGKFTSYGHDFANGDSNPDDDNGHGTHVGGIIGANTDNNLGVASIGRQTKLMAIKVLDSGGSGQYSWIASGITAAADNGADIINMSLGGSTNSQTLHNAVDYAFGQGVLEVAASGNSGSSNMFYPAAYSNVMAIGATTSSDVRASYSNYGSWLEMVAPGSSIQSAWCCSANYANASGTSMASPHVAAVAALLLAVDPTLTHNEMWGILQGSAVDLGSSGFDNFYGWGRVNADDAVATAVAGSGNTATPTITPSPTPSPTPTPITVILNPVADAYVDAGSPNTNFGLLPKLLTNSGTVRNGYLRFDASGVNGNIILAELRLYSMSGSSAGYDARGVADNSWGETTVTFNSAPAAGGVAGSSGAITANSWTLANVTSAVAAGGLVSLAVTSTDPNPIFLLPREQANFKPELRITYTGASPTSTPTSAASATPTTAPSATATPSPSPSPTRTSTATPTTPPTITPSPTASATRTSTATPTTPPTATPSPTASATRTSTATPTVTSTPTVTPIPTATFTPSPSPTATLTATPVPTATATNTRTSTPTFTPSPTATSSPTATATPSTFVFTTEADAFVLSANPGGNYGTDIRLRTNASPAENSYVRFNVQGPSKTVTSAVLRARPLTASSSGFNVHAANSSAWGETTITFNNAPGFGGAIVGSGGFNANEWVSVNVTSAVTGNGQVTFALTGANASVTAYAAREFSSGTFAAQLVVVTP